MDTLLKNTKQTAFPQRESGCNYPIWNSKLVQMHTEQGRVLNIELYIFIRKLPQQFINCEVELTKELKAHKKLVVFKLINSATK